MYQFLWPDDFLFGVLSEEKEKKEACVNNCFDLKIFLEVFPYSGT